jgi:hypothetical protein
MAAFVGALGGVALTLLLARGALHTTLAAAVRRGGGGAAGRTERPGHT